MKAIEQVRESQGQEGGLAPALLRNSHSACAKPRSMRTSEVTFRMFCAVHVPRPARELVLRHIESLRRALPEAKASWARDANIHLTLKFLGDIPQSSVTNLSNAAARAAATVTPFSIQIERTGVFPNRRQPRVLWIGITDASGGLARLYKRLEDEAAKEGFKREGRPFHPHLTVARLRHRAKAQALAAAHQQLVFNPVEIEVSELLVIRSELGSAGSKYTTISSHRLGAT